MSEAQAQDQSRSVSFQQISGWATDQHAKAWSVFHTSCRSIVKKKSAMREAKPATVALLNVCEQAVRLPTKLSDEKARQFFETHFEPVLLKGENKGFMTGYYEPEFSGSRKKTAEFSVPVYKKPKDLVMFKQNESKPEALKEFAAARRTSAGELVAYHDRAAIEEGALQGQNLELIYMKDAFELFTAQVQGSSRIKMPDGSIIRIGYDGRNGYPYTSIGKVMLDRGLFKDKNEISMQAIGNKLAKDKDLARDVMRQNRSYIFFRELEDHDPNHGPLGGQDLPLTPFRSIAIDRTIHTYGLPFFIDGKLPTATGEKNFKQLVIAQDTGTAIVGEARVDLFCGAGEEATFLAGMLKTNMSLYMLRPKS